MNMQIQAHWWMHEQQQLYVLVKFKQSRSYSIKQIRVLVYGNKNHIILAITFPGNKSRTKGKEEYMASISNLPIMQFSGIRMCNKIPDLLMVKHGKFSKPCKNNFFLKCSYSVKEIRILFPEMHKLGKKSICVMCKSFSRFHYIIQWSN